MTNNVCDNVDCPKNHKGKVYRVKIKDEFEGGFAYWCADCIERDQEILKIQS